MPISHHYQDITQPLKQHTNMITDSLRLQKSLLSKMNMFDMITERLEKEPICLVCPIIRDRFNITLSAAPVKTLYISFPKPASDDFPITNPCLQNCSGGRPRTLEAPAVGYQHVSFSQLFFKQ